ncbi:conjugal transfer protein TraH 1 (plasmid) [Rhizobium gallicum]|uniref:Conjugal transfer protein TraH 1 n=1 Tax=Rhizobium gallicum TaxID=56730 RepID=A0A1L5NPI7_9HYPH|nr:TraH family protein [Rhizobium gallicum]APO69798.1 conjugal transfer protein TraH 1 [Rhizobium gallicum]
MVDAALIKECADPGLKPAIVEKFIAAAGSDDPLTVTVHSGKRVVLVPKPATPEAAMDLIRQNIGRNVVRVGITQYPAGLGVLEADELKPDLVDACANLRMGTALFAKVYRIVLKWYGNPTGEEAGRQVFEDAIIAWQAGYFEGEAVFRTPDAGGVKVDTPGDAEPETSIAKETAVPDAEDRSEPAQDRLPDADPNKASIRVDLSSIGAK